MKAATKIAWVGIISFLLILICFNAITSIRSSQIQEDDSLGTIYVVPHSHWDPWYRFSYKENMEFAANNIIMALDWISLNPAYHYTIDQVEIIRYLWNTYPEVRDKLRNSIQSGNIEIVGGSVCEPDENIGQEEVLLENFISGMRWLDETFNISVKVMWQTDVFGHTAELPKIMESLGIKYLYIQRAYNTSTGPFIWEAGDGSQALVWKFNYDHWSISSFNFMKEMKTFIENAPTEYSNPSKNIMWPIGGDFVPPHPNLVQMVEQWNTLYAEEMGYKAILSTPSQFFEAFEESTNYTDLFHYEGDLNPTLSGGQTSYIELKQSQRNIEYALLSSERFAVINNLHGSNRYPEQQLNDLWWNDTLYQHHDTITGTSALEVAKAYPELFGQLEKSSNQLLETQLNQIAASINTSASMGNLTYVLFNSLSWDRHEVVEIPISITQSGVKAITVYDLSSNEKVPSQIIFHSNHSGDNSIANASLFIEASVPSLGFNCYDLQFNTSYENPLPAWFQAPNITISDGAELFNVSSDNLNLTFSKLKGGDLISLIYKGTPILDSSKSATVNVYSSTNSIYGVDLNTILNKTANQIISNIEILAIGPLFGQFKITNQIIGFEIQRIVTVIWNDSMIDFEINISSNYDYAAMLTQQIPLEIQSAQIRLGTPYGSIIPPSYKQDLHINLPSMYWMTGYNSSIGLGVVDYGLISKRIDGNSMYIDLYHNSDLISSLSDTRVYNETKQITVNFALLPYEKSGSPEISPSAYQTGYEYNFPIYPRLNSIHSGTLSSQYSLLSINDSRAILTRLMEDKGDLIVRINNFDNNANVSYSMDFNSDIPETFLNLQRINSIGLDAENLSFSQAGFNDSLQPMAMQTYKIQRNYTFYNIKIRNEQIKINQVFTHATLKIRLTCYNASTVEMLYSYTGTNWESVELIKAGNIFTLTYPVESKSNLYIKFKVTDVNGDVHILEYGLFHVNWDFLTLILVNGLIAVAIFLIYSLIIKKKILAVKQEQNEIHESNATLSKIQFYLLSFTITFIFCNIIFSLELNQTSNLFPYFNKDTFYYQVQYFFQNFSLFLYLLIGIIICLFLTSLIYMKIKHVRIVILIIPLFIFMPLLSLSYLTMWANIFQNDLFADLLRMEMTIYTAGWMILVIFGIGLVISSYVIHKFQPKLDPNYIPILKRPLIREGKLGNFINTAKGNIIYRIIINAVMLIVSFYIFNMLVGPNLTTIVSDDIVESIGFIIFIGIFWAIFYPLFYFTSSERLVYYHTLSRVLITLGFLSISLFLTSNPFYISSIPVFFFSYDLLFLILLGCLIGGLISKLLVFILKAFLIKIRDLIKPQK